MQYFAVLNCKTLLIQFTAFNTVLIDGCSIFFLFHFLSYCKHLIIGAMIGLVVFCCCYFKVAM